MIEKIILTLTSSVKLRPKLTKLFNYFGGFEKLWYEATLSDFLKIGIKKEYYEFFQEIKNAGFDESKYQLFKDNQIKIIVKNQKEYPSLLSKISDPPVIIFVRGDIFYDRAISIVGSRKPTRYGNGLALSFSEKAAQKGLTIISGLAIGIDALSHRGALFGEGKTIAVLGSGLDDNSIYPQSNYNLAKKIIQQGGALISEYPPTYPIHKMNFPERNRIIAGLSDATLIVEANEKSGSLITADFALNYGREVMAIPGDINRVESKGTNKLIKDGATPILDFGDILDFYGIVENSNYSYLTDHNQLLIIAVLKEGPSHIDRIVKKSGLTPAEVSSTLSLLEIKGVIINQGAQNFVLK